MSYVLGASVLWALMKGRSSVIQRLERTERKDVLVPQPVVAEIAFGIERLPRSERKDQLAKLLRDVRRTFGVAMWNDAVTDHYARARAALDARGLRMRDVDVAVAAHALALDAVLVTANRSRMSRVPGLRVEDWSR